jgi:hypothetical protein
MLFAEYVESIPILDGKDFSYAEGFSLVPGIPEKRERLKL